MTPELTALERRAVACLKWRWLPGMRWTYPPKPGGYGPLDGGGRLDETEATYLWPPEGAAPDLEDPATVGCILALVREVWTDPRIHAAPALYSHESPPEYQYTISHWHVYSPGPYNPLTEPPKCAVTGKTEAEALVKALETAP
jgi:hypothetical protein